MKRYLVSVCALLVVGTAFGQVEYAPPIAPASDEGEQAIGRFSAPEDMQIELFAAEPHLANPVAFYFDHQGRVFVAETFRHHQGVTDMREHTEWLVDDLAARTVEDRLVAMKKNLGDEFASYAEHHDRVRLIVDEDGDGKADSATVFADGFRDALAGIGSGVLMDRGNLYYTCIPELWKLRDDDGDGVADERKVLSSGYGVHINFLGHDSHGLRKGPEGRLYFSIGDRGVHIKLDDGSIIDDPDTGTVLRCFPDGSGLEIVHRGLRNPQELAFDNYGNLFTGDNNSDAGDQARLVWIVPGGDSGWRIGYQWVTQPNTRGPWNAEKMWHPYHEGQPAHIVPPITNIGAGPSGFTHYPGTGLPARYANHFFMCDFRGDAGKSLIHTFRVEPKGAYFEMVDREDFANHMLCTDVDFGMDGGIYFSDWVQGWAQPLKGRLYRIFAPELEEDPLISETKKLLSEGFAHRSTDELVSLLGHADQRVRLEAQYTIADRHEEAGAIFAEVAKSSGELIPRLHGVWGLWQRALAGDDETEALIDLLYDSNAEIRAQAARVLGDVEAADAANELANAVPDANPRVAFFAATSLANMPRTDGAMDALVALLRTNDNADPYLRHAAAYGLTAQASPSDLSALGGDESAAVRLGAVLALRRLKDDAIVRFLRDEDAFVRAETVRAIHDTPINDAMPALASYTSDVKDADRNNAYVMRRIINAHLILADGARAQGLAAIALRRDLSEDLRTEALRHLGDWTNPPVLDRVTGAWRRVEQGKKTEARTAVARIAGPLLDNAPTSVRAEMARLAGQYGLTDVLPALQRIAQDESADSPIRIASLESLAALNAPGLREAVDVALKSEDSDVRLAALAQLASVSPDKAVPLIGETMADGSIEEQQAALRTLAKVKGGAAANMTASLMKRFLRGETAPELSLEILAAARATQNNDVAELLNKYEAKLPTDDPVAKYQPAIYGGTARQGAAIFFEKTEVSCVRCHYMRGRGGEDVGPDLTEVGARLSREEILRSIVTPNAAIAEGYENVTLFTKNGTQYAGRVIREDDTSVVLEMPRAQYDAEFWDDGFGEKAHSVVDVVAEAPDSEPKIPEPNVVHIAVDKNEIEERRPNLSSMPEGLADLLSMEEIRNLVEFLADQD